MGSRASVKKLKQGWPWYRTAAAVFIVGRNNFIIVRNNLGMQKEKIQQESERSMMETEQEGVGYDN